VEKRIVNTQNSDCQPYSQHEFKVFFGDVWQRYWDDALRLRPSTVTAFPAVDESDGEELVPFAGLAVREEPNQLRMSPLVTEVRRLHELGGLVAVPKRSVRTRRSSPRTSLRRDVEDKVMILLRLGLPRALAVAVLRWR
jgi:hypothetical protein